MANTLKLGNGTWATKKGSTLAYNDENDRYKPLPFTTTRNSIATRVNKEGLIEVVENDRPRIDYTDSADGVLLLEAASTNVFLHSNQFDTTWQGNYTVLTSGQIGVGGSTDAWLLSGLAGTSEKRIRQYPPSSGNYAVSVYAKAGTVDYLWLRGVTSGANIRTFFNLSTGQVGLDGAVSSNMVDMGNGWYRCEAVFNQQAGFEFYIGLSDKESASTSTTGNIYIQNSQAESGNTASSYIPTQGSTVTRAADTASGAGNSEVFNDSEGVLFADIAALANIGNGQIRIMEQGVLNSVLMEFRDSGTTLRTYIFDGDATNQFLSETNINPNDNIKIALKYKQNDCSLYLNGFVIATDTIATMPSNLNTLSFNQGDGGNPFYGKTKELGYYDTALTDEELEYMTSYRTLNELVTELNLKAL